MKLNKYTVDKYVAELSKKVPAPGGGSASALTGALGAALITMVARYSLRRSSSKGLKAKLRNLILRSENIRKELIKLIDLDAKAYLKVVQARKGTPQRKKKALREAREVPLKVCRLCYKAIDLTPLLVGEGNRSLLCDIEVALELLTAAFNGAMINVEVNQ